MAHAQQAEFVGIVKRHLPQFFTAGSVIEMGSLDINGSVRHQFSVARYVGVDLAPGPGVDLVSLGHQVDLPSSSFDCAVSMNCFEHNPYWLDTFINMLRLARAGGLVVVSTATTGCREHGTRRSAPESSPHTVAQGWTYYRNLTERDFTRRLALRRWLSDWRFFVSHESYDLYFVGLRLGAGALLPAALEADVLARFRPWRSAKALKRFIKVALLRNFWSSPLSYYFSGKR